MGSRRTSAGPRTGRKSTATSMLPAPRRNECLQDTCIAYMTSTLCMHYGTICVSLLSVVFSKKLHSCSATIRRTRTASAVAYRTPTAVAYSGMHCAKKITMHEDERKIEDVLGQVSWRGSVQKFKRLRNRSAFHLLKNRTFIILGLADSQQVGA